MVALHPRQAAALGLVAVLAIALALGALDEQLTRSIQSLVLVVPVVVAAVVGGRLAAFVVAGGATLAFALLIPPVLSVRIAVIEDLVALAVFGTVAVLVSMLVARRIEAMSQVEHDRAVLLRSVSHDLRTPLAAIDAASSELATGADHDPTTRQRLLGLISAEAERLDRMVSNLLSLGRIEAGAMAPRLQTVDLGELVEHSTARLARALEPVSLRVAVPPDLPLLQADHTQLDQVVSNLLENAARHSPPGGTVEVTATAAAGCIELSVTDEGPGVPEADRDAIFTVFRSGAIAGSSGVGLAICRAIVEAHGGTISVTDRPGGGARFVVRLPTR